MYYLIIITFILCYRKNGENPIQNLKEKLQDACGNLKRSVSTISDKKKLLIIIITSTATHDYNNNNDLYNCKHTKKKKKNARFRFWVQRKACNGRAL